jgi:multidrug efflux pump subunit AcrA (membrane-fusion protein)
MSARIKTKTIKNASIQAMKRQYNWKKIGIIGGSSLVVLVLIILLANKSADIVTEDAKIGTLTRTIDLTGKVVPADEVDLGFASAGRISSISVVEGQKVSRGQVLATLDSSEVDASLRQAIAERNVSETESSSLSGKLDTQKRDAYNAIQKALNTSVTQIKTNTDTLLNDPQSAKPKFKYAIRDYNFQQSLSQQRVDVGNTLESWTKEVSTLSPEIVTMEDLQLASRNLNQISEYLRGVSTSLSDVEPTVSVPETTLSEYKALVTNARSAVDSAISNVSTAQENLRSTGSELPVQQAKITAASASIDKYNAQRNNFVIIAPFEGVVVGVDATAGETISSNEPIISLMSNSSVEIEVFVPEIYMKDLGVNDPARITFEALGEDFVVGATVVYVESRGVERNGIVTYKTTLSLAVDSLDIKSGMTALIEIDTLVVENLLLIPKSSVQLVDKVVTDVNNIKAKVKILEDNGDVVEKEIVIGRNDSAGLVEVISGLEVGQKVVVSSVE